jgi:DNA (cytosine-5)-methyltransferase 1
VTPKYGSLFSGIGGLDSAVEVVTGATVAWHCETDSPASTVLAHHWPETPNLGDVTTVDWSRVEPVDVLCGGFPCVDISYAGRGAGLKEGTHSGLWYRFADAIRVLRPRLVVVENVRSLLIRGFDIVADNLAALGYDFSWTCIPASAIGAPHRRDRVFIAAWPAATGPYNLRRQGPGALGNHRGGDQGPDGLNLLPTPTASDSTGVGAHGSGGLNLRTTIDLLPTPTANEPGGSIERYHARLAAYDGRTANYAPLGMLVEQTSAESLWGRYAPAVERWERVLGRPAPHPVTAGRLSSWLVEWMMGFPEGHVCDRMSRGAALRALGNTVVAQQAEAALLDCLYDGRAGEDLT